MKTQIAALVLCGLGVSIATAQPFTKITGTPETTGSGDASGASWVDFDGDGDFDLFVSNRDVGNRLLENDGTGAFQVLVRAPLTSNRSIGSCWADYDNDGDLDAFTSGNPSYLYRNDGGVFSDQTASLGASDLRGWSCAWADYDRDGLADLFITHPAGFVGSPSKLNFLFHNDGEGQFSEVAGNPVSDGLAPYTVGTWSDYDDDGDDDLFVGAGPANGTTAPDFLFKNQLTETGEATFQPITTSPIATDRQDGQVWRWVDWDNDGDLDAYLTNYWGGRSGGMANAMYTNVGAEYVRVTGQPIVTDVGLSLANVWADFDNDGDLDFFVANDATGLGGLNRFYRNDGEGKFTRLSLGALTTDRARRWGGTAADIDDDGDIDLFVPSLRNSAGQSSDFLYRNDLANGNRWLKVRLVATTSNGSALGAVVRARSGGLEQRRDVSSQDTFNGQGMLDVHFGLGASGVVDEVEVVWPSGAVDRFADVAAGQTFEAVEGGSTVSVEPVTETPEVVAVNVFPNPVTDTMVVEADFEGDLVILDLLGRPVWSGPVTPGVTRVEVAGLPTGVYLWKALPNEGAPGRGLGGRVVLVR